MAIPRTIWRWAFYDFANSSYVLVYAALLLPVFFVNTFPEQGNVLGAWGLANAIATLFGVITAVIIGKYSDQHSKFDALKWSVLVSFVGMVLVAGAVRYQPTWVYILFILTQAAFIVSLSLSDSILPHVASKEDAYEYSGFAWGFGYVGGIAALLVAIVLQKILHAELHPLVFLSTAFFYIIFSIHALRGLRSVPLNEPAPVKSAVSLSKTQRTLLLLGYWFISEGITVILLFITIFLAKERGYSTATIGGIILLVQMIAFPATWYGGRLAKRFSTLLLLGLSMLCWGLTILFLLSNVGVVSVIGMIVTGALAVGNSQSYLRAQYATLIDRSESGFQFGIYSIVSQAAVFVGPIAYGFASDYFGSQKIPLVILYGTMMVGYALIWVMVRRGRVHA